MKSSTAASNKRVFDLAIKDLRQITRDKKSFLFLLIMPIAFTLLFGFAFGGNSTADPRLPIGLADEDGSDLSQRLAALLAASEVVRIEMPERGWTELQQQVADGAVAAAVLIPAGFGESLLGDTPQPVTVVGGGQSGFTVEGEVQASAVRLKSAVETANLSLETAVAQGVVDQAGQGAYFEEALAACDGGLGLAAGADSP